MPFPQDLRVKPWAESPSLADFSSMTLAEAPPTSQTRSPALEWGTTVGIHDFCLCVHPCLPLISHCGLSPLTLRPCVDWMGLTPNLHPSCHTQSCLTVGSARLSQVCLEQGESAAVASSRGWDLRDRTHIRFKTKRLPALDSGSAFHAHLLSCSQDANLLALFPSHVSSPPLPHPRPGHQPLSPGPSQLPSLGSPLPPSPTQQSVILLEPGQMVPLLCSRCPSCGFSSHTW